MENNQQYYYCDQHQWLLHHHHQQQQQQKQQELQEQEEKVVLGVSSCDDSASYYPPGYRFCPTDEELVSKYLVELMHHGDHHHQDHQPPLSKRRCRHTIHEVDIYKNSPEVITSEYPLGAVNKKNEWFFITPLERKYPKGCRPSRTCIGSGYWKPTGKDKKITVDNVVARKKCLEFFQGKSPAGQKTDWKMHEYRIENDQRDSAPTKHGELKRKKVQLGPALCRIYLNTRKKDKKDQESSEVMNENDNTSDESAGSNLEVKYGVDANAITQDPYDHADGLMNPDHYVQSASDYGAFNPYYANGSTLLYNFNNNQEFVNQLGPYGFGYGSLAQIES